MATTTTTTTTTNAIYGRFVNNDDNRYSLEKPYIYHGPDLGFPSTNLAFKEAPLNSLTDLRNVPDSQRPTIETHGFCFIANESKELGKVTDENDSQPYAKEMAEVLRKLLGASKVVPVHTAYLRINCPKLRSANQDHMLARPGTEAHMDTTMYDAWSRIRALISPEEQDLVLSGACRARIVNLWRPLHHPADSHPLAMLDPNSVSYDTDHMALDHVTPSMNAETAYLLYNPAHKWYWLSGQTPNEPWVFTQYDTHPPDGKFNHVGHCSFPNPSAPSNAPPRQSIEARFTVLSPAPYTKTVTLTEPRPVENRRQIWKEVLGKEGKDGGWKPTYKEEDSLAAGEVKDAAA
ncbi:hypothetical protein DL768_010899 [Monosporascus sp. mg162]|nr:hypothetical protein DL768_010899 [Monosporascus sp. mg162]